MDWGANIKYSHIVLMPVLKIANNTTNTSLAVEKKQSCLPLWTDNPLIHVIVGDYLIVFINAWKYANFWRAKCYAKPGQGKVPSAILLVEQRHSSPGLLPPISSSLFIPQAACDWCPEEERHSWVSTLHQLISPFITPQLAENHPISILTFMPYPLRLALF